MNASELSRQLLFYGYDEVTDYLKNSPLNRYIYKKFLTILPEYGITVPLVTMFNEIYYQCVRVNYDGMPGVIEREKPHQTIDIPQAGQVNISPQQVNNYSKEAER